MKSASKQKAGFVSPLPSARRHDENGETKDWVWIFMETNKTVNLVLLVMIAVSTVALCLETVREFAQYRLLFAIVEIAFVAIFTVEYIVRFWATPQSKFVFMFNFMNLIDLCAVAPFYLELIVELFFRPGICLIL